MPTEFWMTFIGPLLTVLVTAFVGWLTKRGNDIKAAELATKIDTKSDRIVKDLAENTETTRAAVDAAQSADKKAAEAVTKNVEASATIIEKFDTLASQTNGLVEKRVGDAHDLGYHKAMTETIADHSQRLARLELANKQILDEHHKTQEMLKEVLKKVA